MKLKSLKMARNCISLVLSENKKKDNILIDMGKEAEQDIMECIVSIEDRIEKLEKANTEVEGTGWSFPIIIDTEHSPEYLRKKVNI